MKSLSRPALLVIVLALAAGGTFEVISSRGAQIPVVRATDLPRFLRGPAGGSRSPAAEPMARRSDASAEVAVYRGLGTWIDVYDVAWAHPGIAVRRMRARGVQTLYLQTSNFSRTRPFVYRDGVVRFLDAAHRNGISVVAWYLPGLRDLATDRERTLAAIRLRTPAGNRFDSFAMDIEADVVRSPATRTRRLLRLTTQIRRAVGRDYPLGAIIPSPLRLSIDTRYWPRFPYARLKREYDVFLPMTYFTYRVHGGVGARTYTGGNIRLVRRQTGDRSVPIHVIGGIGGSAGGAETRGFVNAVRGHHAIGASYYTFPFVSAGEWAQLSRVPRGPGGDHGPGAPAP